MSIIGNAGLPRRSALRTATLQINHSGPELVLPGTAMRLSCHTNYTAVTSCRVTVRPRTRSVLRALRPLPPATRYSERTHTTRPPEQRIRPDALTVDTLGGNQPTLSCWMNPRHGLRREAFQDFASMVRIGPNADNAEPRHERSTPQPVTDEDGGRA